MILAAHLEEGKMYSVVLGSYGNNQSEIKIRQDPNTLDIRGYRFINGQLDSTYPLKKKDVQRIKEDPSTILSFHQNGLEPTINAKGKIEWVRDSIATQIREQRIRDQPATVDRHSNDSTSNLSNSSSSTSGGESSSTVHHSLAPVDPSLQGISEPDPQLSLRSLLPLAENPLRQTHPLGFPMGASGTDYVQKYPEWCENVLSSPRMRGSSYEKEIKRCEQEMGLENLRRELSQKEKGWKTAIDRALNIIQDLPEVNLTNLKQIYSQFQTIYGNVYQFVFLQVQNVMKLNNDKHAFLSCFQMDFYGELKGVFPERDQVPFANIRLKIFESQIQTDLEESSSKIKKLQEEYPESSEKIEELARLAKVFVQRTRNELNRKINDYLCWPEVSSCWMKIFRRCPNLQEKYSQMKSGRFSSLSEISHDYQANFYKDPYIILFSDIVSECERFASSPQGTEDLNQMKQAIGEIYGLHKKKLDHFDSRIEPIVFVRDLIQNILQWPGVYELSKGEKHYLSIAVYWLITISNKELDREPKIPYRYQNIPDKERANAVRTLGSPGKTNAQKREACRLLFYSRIPWKALLAVGTLFHGGGGIKPEQVALNRKLLGETIIDIYDELRIVAEVMTDLIDFELSEFSSTPSLQPPTELPEDCLRYIHLLGNREQIINNLNEMCSILQWWDSASLDASLLNEIKGKYAVLRTIQMIGELSKNLRQAGLLNVDDSASRCIEQLRDLLAHLEKFKVNKRLQALLEMDRLPGCDFKCIIEDFKELLRYFQQLRIEISRAKEWVEIKNLQNIDRDQSQLSVKSLRTLVIYLDSHISVEEQMALRIAAMGEDAKYKRREIYQIKEGFLAGRYERVSCEEKIMKLPLTKVKQNNLRSGIKSLLNLRSYYRRGPHFRSGATDPKMLNTIKKYGENKNTPEDERAMFLALRDKLLEGCPSPDRGSSSEQASPRVLDAQKQFAALIKLRKERGTCNIELENVEKRFNELTESFGAFAERKKEEFEPILHSFDAYEDDSHIDHKVTELIEEMEKNSVSLDELSLRIQALGVDGDVRWQEASRQYGLRLAKGAAAPLAEASETTQQVDLAKIKWSATSILRILDQLHAFLPDGLAEYPTDKLIQLACQFLYSSFRGRAITLEFGIEFLKSIFPFHRDGLNAIQEMLNKVIDQANGVLHVHTATEVTSLTTYGQAFVEGTFLSELTKDLSFVRERQLTINSLRTSLRTSLELIESHETSSTVSSST